MHTSPFAEDEPQRNVSMTVDIPEATNDTLQLIKTAMRAVIGYGSPDSVTPKRVSSLKI